MLLAVGRGRLSGDVAPYRTRMLEDFDVFLHMGWSTVPLTSEEGPGSRTNDGSASVEEILDACAAFDVRRILSSFQQRPSTGTQPFRPLRRLPADPLGHYARAKLMAEQIIRAHPQRLCGAASCESQMSLGLPTCRGRKASSLAFAERFMMAQ